jgi:hypothetical protein
MSSLKDFIEPVCVITTSTGILHYRDNFQTPKFTSIFTDSKGNEYRRWTFKFSARDWRDILKQNYQVEKVCATRTPNVVTINGYEIVITPYKVVIKYSIRGTGEVALTLDSWNKVLKCSYPVGWTPLNSVDCRVTLNNCHYLTLECSADWITFFITKQIREAISEQRILHKTSHIIDFIGEDLHIYHPRDNEWPVCFTPSDVVLLKKRLAIPVPEK